MTHETFASNAGFGLAMAFAGFILGLAYFAALRRTVADLAAGNGRLFLSWLALARYGGVAIFLAFAARLGAISLLATFVGFLLARLVALSALRSNARHDKGLRSPKSVS
ncbi:MAG: ATP synthase subunit I [Methylocystis sp.]